MYVERVIFDAIRCKITLLFHGKSASCQSDLNNGLRIFVCNVVANLLSSSPSFLKRWCKLHPLASTIINCILWLGIQFQTPSYTIFHIGIIYSNVTVTYTSDTFQESIYGVCMFYYPRCIIHLDFFIKRP